MSDDESFCNIMQVLPEWPSDESMGCESPLWGVTSFDTAWQTVDILCDEQPLLFMSKDCALADEGNKPNIDELLSSLNASSENLVYPAVCTSIHINKPPPPISTTMRPTPPICTAIVPPQTSTILPPRIPACHIQSSSLRHMLTTEEHAKNKKEKEAIRKKNNKISAGISRQKLKDRHNSLETENARLKAHNEELLARVSQLERLQNI